MTATCRLTGRLTVPLPPDRAFRLFTPRGERDWIPGWDPHFPAAADDDTAPGTVFETHVHGKSESERTIWVVVDRVPGRRIAYAASPPTEPPARSPSRWTTPAATARSPSPTRSARSPRPETTTSTRSATATWPTSPPGRTPSQPR